MASDAIVTGCCVEQMVKEVVLPRLRSLSIAKPLVDRHVEHLVHPLKQLRHPPATALQVGHC
jgi:hypothetical protein